MRVSSLIRASICAASLFSWIDIAAAELNLGAIASLESKHSLEVSEFQKNEAAVNLKFEARAEERWAATVSLRVRGDLEDRVEPGESRQTERSRYNRRWLLGRDGDAELREFFVDADFGPVFIRLGKQQTVWGQADGLRVLDVVNPFSFREFVWPDAQDRRIALWTAKTELRMGASTLQLVWLPDPTYDEIPLRGSAFDITTPLLIPHGPANVPVGITETERPEGVRDESDYGARWSASFGRWDWTLNYLYHFYDDPVPFLRVSTNGIDVTPRYERSRLLGATAATAFGSTTFRTELGYSKDRWFITKNVLDADRVFNSDELAFVVGLDNTTVTNTLVSVQYFQSRVKTPDAFMTRDLDERQMTLLIQRSFRNDSVKWRTLWLRSMNRGDGGVQSRLSWQLTTNLSIGASVEKFYGDRNGLFGEFRQASRAGIDFQWNASVR